MVGSDINDNLGAGLLVRTAAAPRIERNKFARNGVSGQAERAVVIEPGARPKFASNIFVGVPPAILNALPAADREGNVFVPAEQPRRPNGRGGRR